MNLLLISVLMLVPVPDEIPFGKRDETKSKLTMEAPKVLEVTKLKIPRAVLTAIAGTNEPENKTPAVPKAIKAVSIGGPIILLLLVAVWARRSRLRPWLPLSAAALILLAIAGPLAAVDVSPDWQTGKGIVNAPLVVQRDDKAKNLKLVISRNHLQHLIRVAEKAKK